MDAGPSSAPVLHQMQPPPRPQAPRPVPARVPGAPPVGALRPPVMVGQRAGPVISMQSPKAPIPPQMFKFQAVKRPDSGNPSPAKLPMPNKPPLTSRIPVPYSNPPVYQRPLNFNERRAFRQAINGKSNFQSSSPMSPSTSYADRSLVHKPYTSPPTTSSDFHEDSPPKLEAEDQKHHVEKANTTIELPPNCKLFQYSCEVYGVSRTLLVPMPAHATEEDVMKMLPETFSEMAHKIFQDEVNVAQTELPKLAIPNVDDEPKEEPVLVNPKQYWRIQKRREMRMKLENSGRLPLQRQKYLHESRHRHAVNRKRGIDGRFDPKSPDRDQNQEASPTPTGPQYRATPLTRPARTYAAIRPARDLGGHYGPMSSAGTTRTAYFANEQITSYHEYQQHVQYPDHLYQSSSVSNGASTSDNGGEGASEKSPSDQQNFTNL